MITSKHPTALIGLALLVGLYVLPAAAWTTHMVDDDHYAIVCDSGVVFTYTGRADQLDALGAKLCADSVSDQDQAAAEPRATIQSRQGDAQIEQRGRARADSLHEVAHELTHVVQQCTPQNGAQAVDGQAGVLQCAQRLNLGSHNTTRSNIRG